MNLQNAKNNYNLFGIIALVGLLYFGCKPTKKSPKEKIPNFIVILTDDQGWNGT